MFCRFILLLIFVINEDLTCLGQVIRGVSQKRLSLYNPLQDFSCFDGSQILPFSYVNDDYCDCPDGSDEPGTPACPNGAFYCANQGYVPKYIPSGHVNDGFCDCCDASDEYGNQNCTNTCEELGYEAKRLAEKQSQIVVEGSRIRAQMIISAKSIIESKQKRMNELEAEKTEALRLRDESETLKKEAESKESAALEEFNVKKEAERAQRASEEQHQDFKEAQNYFDSFDTSADGLLQLDELKTQEIFDQNADGTVADEELKYIQDASSEPLTFELFKEVVWPRIKPTIIMNKIKIDDFPQDKSNNEDFQLPIPPDGQEDEQSDSPSPVKEDDNIDYDTAAGEDNEEEEEDDSDVNKGHAESPNPEYDEKTRGLVEAASEAREHFEKASRVVQDVEREMTNHKNFLSKDYGEEDEFVPLDGQCFTFTDREYSYKLCPFDQVTQMPKSGGSETRLGTWNGWHDKNYSVMLYDKGQSCWNGPQRSTKVNVACGLENEVVSASEPNKCEYVLDFKTPAACAQKKPKDVHEEL